MNLIPFSTEPCKYEGWRMNVPRNLSIGTLSPAFYSFTHLLNGQESLEITDWHNDIGHSLSLSFSTVGACLGLSRDPSLSYIVIMMLSFFFFFLNLHAITRSYAYELIQPGGIRG